MSNNESLWLKSSCGHDVPPHGLRLQAGRTGLAAAGSQAASGTAPGTAGGSGEPITLTFMLATGRGVALKVLPERMRLDYICEAARTALVKSNGACAAPRRAVCTQHSTALHSVWQQLVKRTACIRISCCLNPQP